MIFVTGAARSGTSLTMKILQEHGLWLGRPGEVNELYEHLAMRQGVLKPLLASVGADPLGQGPLPEMSKWKPDNRLRNRVMQHFNDCPEPWGYKDAKLTLTWPVWAEAFPEAKWVIVRRDTEQIIDSCLRTRFMKRYGIDRNRWTTWVQFHLAQFEAMEAAGLKTLEIWPGDFIDEPNLFAPAVYHCGLEQFDYRKVKSAIDPTLWRS